MDNDTSTGFRIPRQLHNQRFIRVKDKRPIDLNWQLEVGGTNFSIDDKSFIEYLDRTKQYGVLCGFNNLIVIDFDDEETMKAVLEEGTLPKTFSVKTARKGLLHLYYYTDNSMSWKILDKDKNTLADVQGKTKQVIGPGSRIPDGREYVVVDDIDIATVSATVIHKALDRFDYGKNVERLAQTSEGLTLNDFTGKHSGPDRALEDIKRQLRVSDLLHENGISTARNPTKCPFHGSKGGKCFGFDDKTGVWHCFHCEEKGDAITLWQKLNNVDDFLDAKKQLCEKFNIEDTYIPPPVVEPVKNSKPNVQLPQDNRTVLDFAADLAVHFKECSEIFYKVDEKCIVEITEYMDKQLKQLIVGFDVVTAGRLFNIIEWKVNTYNTQRVKKQEVMIRKSANEQMIKLVSTNQAFRECLHKIKRLLNYPIPYIESDGTFCIPIKGYDPRYQAYFTPNTPELTMMNVDDAKAVLYDIISEFCFKDTQDRDMAISYILTPMCRGLYHRPNSRTPLYIIQANRERAGKDYLAGVIGIIYEDKALDDTPFVTGDKSENANEEWRKKFTTALRAGRRRIHSSNNRGFLNSSVLEQFLTSEMWVDRQLGGNVSLELNNEIDVSMSANLGLTYTPDLWNRARPINLFYGEENANDRVYVRSDLWGYVRQNRGLILSAIYTLIKTWFDAGRPPSNTPFTSFPEWSRVVGGVMEYHGMGNPCIQIEDVEIGGDKETQSMKELFKFMAEYAHNNPDAKRKGFTIGDIRKIISEAQSSGDFEGFADWDFSEKPSQVKLGNIIRRFVGRFFNCKSYLLGENSRVLLEIAVANERTQRQLYMFKTDKPITRSMRKKEDEEDEIKEETLYGKEEIININDKIIKFMLGKGMVAIDFLIAQGISEHAVEEAKHTGLLFEPKPGFVRLMNE